MLPPGDDTLEWYSRAIIEMKRRPIRNPASWSYQAAIHGFDARNPFWRGVGTLPGQAERREFWNQCQHQSWFFLPWHRMYLAFFEQIVAQTIADLGGPQEWALPFWDYSDTTNANARIIPRAFRDPAIAANGLWIPGRASDRVRERDVTLGALNTLPYAGDGQISPLGFGGPETTFSHFGNTNGVLENTPHNAIHVSIGGAMGNPVTAGLDPIFWLHHCNIDRLWQVWLNRGNRINPSKASWLDFRFDFHDKDGNSIEMSCREVENTSNILSGYTYQGVAPSVPAPEAESFIIENMESSMPLEVVAASNKQLKLGSETTTVQLKLNAPRKKKVKLEAIHEPETTFLHFENITAKGSPPIQDVYINVPEDAGEKKSFYAGSLNLFGVAESSIADLHHPGSGQHYALDVSELMNELRTLPNWKEEKLDVSIEPAWKMENASVKIGRISLYSK